MIEAILTLNVGSSSVKFALFAVDDERDCILRGKVDLQGAAPVFRTNAGHDEALEHGADAIGALRHIMQVVGDVSEYRIVACAHRIVHGGEDFDSPAVLNTHALQALAKYLPLAPLHQGHNLHAAEIIMEAYPELLHVGCFDTAFHRTAPSRATTYALPAAIRDKGVRRFGFHGLSYAWIAEDLSRSRPDLAKGRVVAAHLGSGASLCALKNGESVATTMGLTALDGVPMGTRVGAIDPGAVISMARDLGLDRVEEILYRESGLLGLSGVSGDMRELRLSTSPDAAFAIEVFTHRIAEEIARLSVSLGGLDAVIFTGGVGENDAALREDVAARLAHLPSFETVVIPADEERVMADAAVALLTDSDSLPSVFATRSA